MSTPTTVLRYVSLVSAAGAYGGPSDSALRQAKLMSKSLRVTFMAGYLPGDAPSEPNQITGLSQDLFRAAPILAKKPLASAFSVRGLKRLRDAIRNSDVVYVSIAREAMPVAVGLLSLQQRRRLILQPHGMLTSNDGFLQDLIDVVVGPLIRKANVVVALTDRESAALQLRYRIRPDRIEIHHNPLIAEVEPNPHFGHGHGDEVLYLGRVARRKRVSVFVDAARIATTATLRGRYVVVGPIEDLEPGLSSEVVTYEGSIPPAAVVERLSRCAIFVLPARNEPWGNVLALALALGRPTIVTESAALAPTLKNCGAALVVPDDDPNALATAVHQLLTNDEQRATVSRSAVDFASRRLSDEYQVKRLLEIVDHAGRVDGTDT